MFNFIKRKQKVSNEIETNQTVDIRDILGLDDEFRAMYNADGTPSDSYIASVQANLMIDRAYDIDQYEAKTRNVDTQINTGVSDADLQKAYDSLNYAINELKFNTTRCREFNVKLTDEYRNFA